MARTVFVTGSTGSIGSALVARLLRDPAVTVRLLIRAADESDLQRRAARMRAYWGVADGDERASRIAPVRGDVSQPRFGLDEAAYRELATQCTHIVHCAASVKLNMTLDEARRSAVLPTREVLEFGRQCQRLGRLGKMELVSTVGVWGRTPGVMPERPLPEVKDFHNTYEAAKSEAERVLWSEGRDLPVTLHRPSMVVGETGSGKVIHFQVFYHLCEFLSGRRTYGVMPDLGSQRLDTVPVDWIAEVLTWSMSQAAMAGRVLHLCSGPTHSIPLQDLQRQVRQTWQAAGIRVPRLRRVNAQVLERLVPWIGLVAGAKTRRALRGLPPVLAYLAEDQGFDNAQTLSTLEPAGLPLPPVSQYLDPVLRYYLGSRVDPAAR
jgi:thioester reductase-like protein